MEARKDVELCLAIDEQAAVTRVFVGQGKTRPKATKLQYTGRQLEFEKEWCVQMGYPDAIVNSAKYVLFMDHMRSRPARPPGMSHLYIMQELVPFTSGYCIFFLLRMMRALDPRIRTNSILSIAH